MTETGKAYAIFDCKAPKKRIEKELPYILNSVKASESLELLLFEGIENLLARMEDTEDKKAFTSAIDKEELDGLRYALEATDPEATNRETADDVAAVLNQAYNTSLFRNGDFYGKILYKEGVGYTTRD
jgi:hypothetical protein